ncbi:MAG: hypothetical protein QOG74_2602, partial [Alphaproteobacteria bacterium]|nr:hypothetical protein [Alphaproteobacteria bacterium]
MPAGSGLRGRVASRAEPKISVF